MAALNMQLQLTPALRHLLARLGLGALLLALAAYVLVGMPILEGRQLDRDIAATRLRLERQQKILPALASLGAADNATLKLLCAPKLEPLPRAQAYQLTEQLTHMATAANLETLDATLSTATLAQDPDTIQAQGVFAGQVEGVRAMLLDIARMPSLARVERVELRAVDDRLEMMVQLRVALGG
ncbi:MAG: hypothetical protein AUJ49_09825 [Desulfovibrionaceae bacterium CG1_02_65_16]|nr:MAG: hypothetical protein AUJ49_09825 [Desulfovibrionaceae bacterium CG1_02_65_16]